MKQTTLCLLLRENEILLAMKKRGFGMGKWNGYGGKPEAGESLPETAIREMREEIGVQALARDLEQVASLKFYFKTKVEWDQEVNIFVCRNWQGQPEESEEMKPQWFKFDQIPFAQMWPDDKHWLPKVLAGKHLTGEFYFTEDGTDFEKFELREI
jgi:8-oxo-dGTP pyrophosphatase MutT (NUDIX family)